MSKMKINQCKIQIKCLVVVLLSLQLCSCKQYKKLFAGKGHEYDNITTNNTASIKFKQFNLNYSNRYNIPVIANSKETNKIVDFSPPHYAKGSGFDEL